MAPDSSVPLKSSTLMHLVWMRLLALKYAVFPCPILDAAHTRYNPLAIHTFKTVSSLEYFAKPECHIRAGVESKTSDLIVYSRWNILAIYGFKRAVDITLSNDT